MPILAGSKSENQANNIQEINVTDLGYEYPFDLNLRPGSELHTKIRDEILLRADLGYSEISQRFGSWQEIDKTLTVYTTPDDKEKKTKLRASDKPGKIIYPYSLAILETLLSHVINALWTEPPIRYEGVGPEDVLGAILLEKVVEQHLRRNNVLLNLHTLVRDDLAYGIGVGAPCWKNGGSALLNIDPYSLLPDPGTPLSNVQDAEYIGWVEKSNLYRVLEREQEQSEYLFNGHYLRLFKQLMTSRYASTLGSRNFGHYSLGRNRIGNAVTRPVDIIKMYVKLIPSEWGLANSNNPETWYFELANDEVIIAVAPASLRHKKFPVVVGCSNFDGYSTSPISKIESLQGMQGVLDFLLNSHMKNVVQGVNNKFLIDPQLVNWQDIAENRTFIRMRKVEWGRGVKDALQQLQIHDITRQHVADSEYVASAMQKLSGADDAAMGSLRTTGPERLTSKEFEGTQAGLMARVERIVNVLASQVLKELGYQFAHNTIQLMREENWIKLTGRWSQTLYNIFQPNGRINVRPEDININFDIQVEPATKGMQSIKTLMGLLDMLSNSPELAQKFDTTRIIKYILASTGIKNVDDFVRVEMMPDEQIMRETEKGNIIPNEQANI